jgi:hypothetical protein
VSRSDRVIAWSLSIAAALAAGGCGGSNDSGSTSSSTQTTGNAGALSAEAASAATGDIPDNQVFLVFHNRKAGYAIKYPEGWTQTGSAGKVTFEDKNNLVHITVADGPAPTIASATAELDQLKRSNPSLVVTTAPKQVTIRGSKVIKSGYSTRSQPNPVTGKRVTLLVDRYQFAHNGKVATVDLGTPKGVDNVDAYRLMSESFKWS